MPAQIRWTDPIGDHRARVDVVRRAWHGAYAHILGAERIDALFDGDLTMAGDWTRRRSAPVGTLVAVAGDQVVGVAGLGLMEPGVGEVAALFVAPEWQGSGIGGALWDAGLAVFRHRELERVEVWTFTAAQARGFYEHKGCALIGEGSVDVGDQRIDAVGYGRSLDGISAAPPPGARAASETEG